MPILFERPTYEWVARVNQKHKALTDLPRSGEKKGALNRWIEIEFVFSTLRLAGEEITREQVARFVSAPANSGAPHAVTCLLDSLRAVTSIVSQLGSDSALSVELVGTLNSSTGNYDSRSDDSSAQKQKVILEGALQWFSADSFSELHPIEQASIVLLRFIELHPFVGGSEQTALVAASLFTMRKGLPPIIISEEMQPAYRAALNEGIRMNTKPMVELIAESTDKTLDLMILEAKEI